MTVENLIGKSIHGESRWQSRMNVANVRLVHRYPHLNASEVLSDQEQAGSVEAGDHGLANVYTAIDNHTFDWRLDGAIAEITLRPVQTRLSLGHSRFRLFYRGMGNCYIGLGDLVIGFVLIISAWRQRFGMSELLRAIPVLLGLDQLGLHLQNVGARR